MTLYTTYNKYTAFSKYKLQTVRKESRNMKTQQQAEVFYSGFLSPSPCVLTDLFLTLQHKEKLEKKS